VSILPSRGHVIFTGRPSQYQGSIVKFFASQAVRKCGGPVEYRDLSGEALPLDSNHERLTIVADILAKECRTLVLTAGHYGTSGKLDVSDFKGVARIWECKQHGETLQVTLTESWPTTGREVHLQGTYGNPGIAWHEVAAPEPTPIGHQRTGTNDRGEGMPDAPGARTQLSEWRKCNPGKRALL
jgi:hypothetical protein